MKIVAQAELEILDGLFRHKNAIGRTREQIQRCSGISALEIGVRHSCRCRDVRRVDPIQVLQIGADVCKAVLHRLGSADASRPASSLSLIDAGTCVDPVTVTSAPLVSSASMRAWAW
ncbi:hypothetical protein [Cupriavidus sp. BIC8F]|uniref:hypothetical protein n=1 Tax=Cupriavidus sp. BIC8F TaxID=3079014 RepID=UPI00291623B1|nr:hypothetical protein [Cupriavidus sp. BIC8F]